MLYSLWYGKQIDDFFLSIDIQNFDLDAIDLKQYKNIIFGKKRFQTNTHLFSYHHIIMVLHLLFY